MVPLDAAWRQRLLGAGVSLLVAFFVGVGALTYLVQKSKAATISATGVLFLISLVQGLAFAFLVRALA